MPGFRHPRNPARSPRGPAHIGESPRRSRPPGPRSNRGAIRPLPRRAAPAPPARRRRARACRGRRVGAFRRCGAGRSRCSAGPDLRRHRWPRDAAAPAWRIARGRRCRGGAGDAAMRRSGRGGRRESPRFERGGRRELPQRRQRRERSSQRSAQHHPPEGRARPARRPATPSPLPQADVRGSAPPRARARRAADPEDFGLFSLGRAAAQAPPVRLPAQRPRRPLAPATRSPLPQADVRGSAPPRARACRVFDPEEFGLFSLGRAAAQAPPVRLPAQRPRRPLAPATRSPLPQADVRGSAPPRARARRAADPEEFELFSLGRAATQPPPCDCLLKGHCLPRGRACPKAAPPARPCRRRMSRDPLPPRARARRVASPTRRSSGYSASGAPRRSRRPCDCLPKGRACPKAIACPRAAPAQRPPLPQADVRGSAPPQAWARRVADPEEFEPFSLGRAAAQAPPVRLPAQRPRPPRGRARPGAAPAQRPRLPKGRACQRAAPAQRAVPAQGPRLPKGRPCRRRISGDPLPPQARARRVFDPEAFEPFSLGRAAAQAPPCDCLPRGRARPKAIARQRAAPAQGPRPPKGRARPRAAPAQGPRPPEGRACPRAAHAQGPRMPKGRACPRAAPAQGPRLPKGRACPKAHRAPRHPGGAAGAPRHSAPWRAKRA